MGKMLIAVLLGTAMLLLGQLVFGGGIIMKFFTVSEQITSPGHMVDLASGRADAQLDAMTVIGFIAEIAVYYIAAALIVFFFGLFVPKKKENK